MAYFDYKVGQKVLNVIKLKLDLWHHLLNVSTKFQIDISKHVEKSLENLEKSKICENNRQNSKHKVFEKKKNLC